MADSVWAVLAPKSLEEKAGQFLSDNKLDSFGLTFAVLCGLRDVYPKTDFTLCLSEDHSWISVDDSRVEVTFHAKTDKRGSCEPNPDNWLYLKGHVVHCNTVFMVVAALVSSLNPSLTPNSDSLPLADLQRQLLDLFYTNGHLNKYPMAIGNLADLCELTLNSTSSDLYYEAVSSALVHYDDHHIYPYLYLAGFWFRQGNYREALFAWKQGSRVLSKYNYNPKEDEEAYKEFQEIANDLIPYALNHLTLDCFHYRDLIEFYDGLCSWEEASRWPVLHVGWSKSFLSCLHKFPPGVRSALRVQGEPSGGGTRRQRQEREIQEIVSQCSLDPEFLLKQKSSESRAEAELQVWSQKMREIKELLVHPKLNSSAIQLQITAQSSLFTMKEKRRDLEFWVKK